MTAPCKSNNNLTPLTSVVKCCSYLYGLILRKEAHKVDEQGSLYHLLAVRRPRPSLGQRRWCFALSECACWLLDTRVA